MDRRRDIDDWLCGLPYEYCQPDNAIDFVNKRGFQLQRLRSTRSQGCNEYLFQRVR